MAWRPYENLIDGELDNRTPGKVTGWMRFHRRNAEPLRVTFNLKGDFHEDIRGRLVRLQNANPTDRAETLGHEGTYMEGFSEIQEGEVGDMTAGISPGPWTEEIANRLMQEAEIAWDEKRVPEDARSEMRRQLTEDFQARILAKEAYYPYVDYPYFEWYAKNGRVVLELEGHVVSVVGVNPPEEKTPQESVAGRRNREELMVKFLEEVVENLAKKKREEGDKDGVTGILVS